MQIPSPAATAVCAVLCVLGVSFAPPAGAEAIPEPSALARADAIAEAAHVTALRLRHRWDEARKHQATAAGCLGDKVAQAVVLAKSIEERRAELRDEPDDTSRARTVRRLENLEVRRVLLEGEAVRCK